MTYPFHDLCFCVFVAVVRRHQERNYRRLLWHLGEPMIIIINIIVIIAIIIDQVVASAGLGACLVASVEPWGLPSGFREPWGLPAELVDVGVVATHHRTDRTSQLHFERAAYY